MKIHLFKNSNILFSTLIFSLLIISCKNDKETLTKKNYNILNFKDNVYIDVKKIELKDRVIQINDTCLINYSCSLIYDKREPKWIFNKAKEYNIYNNKKFYIPNISNVDSPYLLIKDQNSNFFKVIKEKDTLLFCLNAFIRNPLGRY